MNENAANTARKPRQTRRLKGRPKVRGKLAERLGRELQRSRVAEGLDLATAAELAEMTPKRLAEIEDGAVTATISTIERIAEKVKMDWATVLMPWIDGADAGLPKSDSEVDRGA